jgi:hypothetical protein
MDAMEMPNRLINTNRDLGRFGPLVNCLANSGT